MRAPFFSTVLAAGLAVGTAAQAQRITPAPLAGNPDTTAIKIPSINPAAGQPGKFMLASIRRRSHAEARASCMVYVGAGGSKVYAVNSNGRLAWTYTAGHAVSSSPTVSGGIVYVGSVDHRLYAINAANGALAWAASTGGAIERTPAVSSGVVYASSNDGKLTAFDARTGAVQWRSAVGLPFAGQPQSAMVFAAAAAERSTP